MYKLTNSMAFVRRADGVCIPNDPANADYAQYLQWLQDGNIPEPADLPNPNDVIDAQIVALEQANPITHRALREFMLGTLAAFKLDPSANHATALVASVEAQADALRAQRK